MPAGSEAIAAGAYTITYDAVSVGLLVGDQQSPTLQQTGPYAQPINNTTTYGRSMIDYVYQGVDYFLTMSFMEWIAGVRTVLWPFGDLGVHGTIGRLGYDVSASTVMTVVAGTPSATTGYSTLTSTKSILAPNNQINISFGPIHRITTARLALLPISSTGIKSFTTT